MLLRLLVDSGNIVEEPDSEKWYEKLWFYITIGIVGGLLCICFICLCVRSHGDNSGRGSYRECLVLYVSLCGARS